MVVSQRRVVEYSGDIVEDLVDRDIGVFPCINDARSDILENCGCNLTGGSVENVRKVVFGEQGVRRVCALGIGPGLVLVLSTKLAAIRTAINLIK